MYQQRLRKIKVLNIERLGDSENIHNDKDSEYRNEYKRLNVIDLK
jgi:hypothetical protein